MKRARGRLAAWVLLALFIVLPRLGHLLRVPALSLLGLVALMGMAFVQLVFNRCPHCRTYLGRVRGKACPKCGESLEE